jgi:hypothetical protein
MTTHRPDLKESEPSDTMKPFYRHLKYTNPYGTKVGFFTEGDTQEEADKEFFKALPERVESLNKIISSLS